MSPLVKRETRSPKPSVAPELLATWAVSRTVSTACAVSSCMVNISTEWKSRVRNTHYDSVGRELELPAHGDIEVKVVVVLDATGLRIKFMGEFELEIHVALFIEQDIEFETVIEPVP